METNILIITGTPEANKKVDEMLHNAGFAWRNTGSLIPTSFVWRNALARVVVHNEGVQCVSHDTRCEAYAGPHRILTSLDLTPEIVATFPGAKPLKPQGPWPYKGVMYEIDGDEKREPGIHDLFIAEIDGIFNGPATTLNCDFTGLYRWILKPIITPELQAAITHQQQTARAVAETRKANKEALERVKALGGKV